MDGFGRGDGGRQRAAAGFVADRPQNPAAIAGRFEDGADHVRRRRLAVGAGDADDVEPARGFAVEGAGQRGQRAARVQNHELRDGPGGAHGLFRDDGDGASRQRVFHEAGAVALVTGDGDENRPRFHAPRIVRDSQDLNLRPVLRDGRMNARQYLRQLAKFHS